MKRLLCLFIILTTIIGSNVLCYADIDEDIFVNKAEDININIVYNDKTILSKGYILWWVPC